MEAARGSISEERFFPVRFPFGVWAENRREASRGASSAIESEDNFIKLELVERGASPFIKLIGIKRILS
jgi:hypothetical protein